jgi:hypothetical protein
MFTFIFSGHRVLALDSSPKRCKMNSRYFCDAVVEEAEWAMMAITGES